MGFHQLEVSWRVQLQEWYQSPGASTFGNYTCAWREPHMALSVLFGYAVQYHQIVVDRH